MIYNNQYQTFVPSLTHFSIWSNISKLLLYFDQIFMFNPKVYRRVLNSQGFQLLHLLLYAFQLVCFEVFKYRNTFCKGSSITLCFWFHSEQISYPCNSRSFLFCVSHSNKKAVFQTFKEILICKTINKYTSHYFLHEVYLFLSSALKENLSKSVRSGPCCRRSPSCFSQRCWAKSRPSRGWRKTSFNLTYDTGNLSLVAARALCFEIVGVIYMYVVNNFSDIRYWF